MNHTQQYMGHPLSTTMRIFNTLAAPFRARAQPGKFDISVIVPVFNKGRFLGSCLDSILAQKNVSLEIVCVDDCSSDTSPEILEKYSRNYSNIRVAKNRRNSGAACARNSGISLASGNFIQFTDADDILPADSLAHLFEAACRTGCDVVKGALQELQNADTSDPTQIYSSLRPTGEEKVGKLLKMPELWIPWFHVTYLISRELVLRKHIIYPKLSVGEDPVFTTLVLTQATTICSIPCVTYRYRKVQRAQHSALAMKDYLRHAEMVRTIYGRTYSECWTAYRAFITPRIFEYIEEANATLHQKNCMRRRLARL
jgi:glycosyltransferase involved in cell wall biosynthesis